MEISRSASALKSVINTVKSDIAEILQSGNFYCTEEIARELTLINNGLEHLRLDGALLSSNDWQKSFNSPQINSSLKGAMNALEKAEFWLYDYKSQMGTRSIQEKMENEVRELHQWAITNLQQIQRELEPFTYGATDRIVQFGDYSGVTDRYTGYRNNLTRSREPFKLETSWMDKGRATGFMNPLTRSQTATSFHSRETLIRPEFEKSSFGSTAPDRIGCLQKEIRFSNNKPAMAAHRGYRTIDSLYPRSTTTVLPGTKVGGAPNYSEHVVDVNTLNYRNEVLAQGLRSADQQQMMKTFSGFTSKSVQEQAGINTTFPGRTEYMIRYNSPMGEEKTIDFIINPKPNVHVFGRPLGYAHYDQNTSEYLSRYEWPDGERICKLPWMRK